MSVHSARSALDDRIARLRQLAHADTRLEGVLLYGSWTVGEADAHSDIEAYLYIHDARLADFDGPAFLAQLAPLQPDHPTHRPRGAMRVLRPPYGP